MVLSGSWFRRIVCAPIFSAGAGVIGAAICATACGADFTSAGADAAVVDLSDLIDAGGLQADVSSAEDGGADADDDARARRRRDGADDEDSSTDDDATTLAADAAESAPSDSGATDATDAKSGSDDGAVRDKADASDTDAGRCPVGERVCKGCGAAPSYCADVCPLIACVVDAGVVIDGAGAVDAGVDASDGCDPPCGPGLKCCPLGAAGLRRCSFPLLGGFCQALP